MKISQKILNHTYSTQRQYKVNKRLKSSKILKRIYEPLSHFVEIAKKQIEELQNRFRFSKGNFIDLHV